LIGSLYGPHLARRGRSISKPERHVLSLWTAHAAAWLGLFALNGPLADPAVPHAAGGWYPAFSVVTGVVWFAHGSIYWGHFYAAGLLFFALGLVMRFTPGLAPLEFGLLQGAVLIAGGQFLRRLHRKSEKEAGE
jgi:hypothetical protein